MEDADYKVDAELLEFDNKKYQRIISPLGVIFYREIQGEKPKYRE